MNAQELMQTAGALVAGDKGLLAMDESNPTCNKRFAKLGIPQTIEARHAYRELIVTTPGLGESISGAILYDETIRDQKTDGTPFAKALADAGIIPGVKVDTGAKDLAAHPGEKITEGLDGLRGRLAEYAEMGARFAKWRAVIAIGDGLPSRACIEGNAHALARYAALCQEAGLVPIVEPEVLMETIFRATALESRFPLNMNVLDATRTPRVMSRETILAKGKGAADLQRNIQLPDGKEVVGVPARGLSRAAAKTCHAAAEFAFTFGFQEAAKRANWYLWSAQCVRVEPAV